MPYPIVRNIVRRGILRLTSDEREVRSIVIRSQIERFPVNASLNYRYSIPRSFFGYAQGLFRGYVMWTNAIEYENQVLWSYQDDFIQDLVNATCLHSFTYNQTWRIANTFGLADNPPIHPLDVFPTRIPLDTVVFNLFGDTTAVITAVGSTIKPFCEPPIEWIEPPPWEEDPPEGTGPFRPPAPPVVPPNPDDPDGLDQGSPPYDGVDDEGFTYRPGSSSQDYQITARGIWCPDAPGNVAQICAIYQENGEEVIFTRTVTSTQLPVIENEPHGNCPSCGGQVVYYYPPGQPRQRLNDLTGSPWAANGTITINPI